MINKIKLGGLDTSSFKVGGDDVDAIYLGNTLVYSGGSAPVTYKLVAQYSDTTEYKVECNSSTKLTSGETKGHSTSYTAMTSAEVGDCVTSIDTYAFYNCSVLANVTIPNSVTDVGIGAFQNCSGLTNVTIPSGVTLINGSTFRGCNSLTSITIPDNVTSIGNSAFYDCTKLKSLTIGSGVTTIDTSAFYRCSGLTSLNTNKVQTIGTTAFAYCSGLKSISLGSTLRTISGSAFANCTGLTSVTIPSSVTTAGTYVFANCSNLSAITFSSTSAPSWLSANFIGSGLSKLQRINIPSCSSYNSYYAKLSGNSAYSTILYASNNACEPLWFKATASGTFKYSGSTIQYSLNGGQSWTTLASNTNTPTVSAGQVIMWKNKGTKTAVARFSSTANFTAGGNIMSLMSDSFATLKSISSASAFTQTFYGCTRLTSIKDLKMPAISLSPYCYANMFQGCTSLAEVPTDLLPATSLQQYCYYGMFQNCTSLTTVPNLPATTLQPYCYQAMFMACTKITTSPTLSAAKLTNYCYNIMFQGCTSLNTVRCYATNISATNCTTNWLNSVASSGTFYKKSSMTSWPRTTSGVPAAWTVQNGA